MPDPVLEVQGMYRSFGGIHALEGVDLSLSRGEVLGLMGDNGAGKSTLVKIIAGNFPPSSGTLLLDGQEVTLHSPLDARQHGIEIVYQDLALCDNLTAALNVFLGRELTRGIGPIRFLDRRAMTRRAGELFAQLKSETRPQGPRPADVRWSAPGRGHRAGRASRIRRSCSWMSRPPRSASARSPRCST